MKLKLRIPGPLVLVPALFILLWALPALAADDFFLYGNQGDANIAEAHAPIVTDGWFTAVDYFRDGPHEGKMLAANNKSVFIQDAPGSSSWTRVAKVDNVMDPSFIRISPSGEKVALGLGFGQELLVFEAALLDSGSPDAPVDLSYNDNVKTFYERYYDAAWVGEDHLVINGGWWIVQGVEANSAVTALDVTSEDNMAVPVTGTILGASSGIAVDEENNLYFGVGYERVDPGQPTRTGEIKVFPADAWWNGAGPIGTALSYDGPHGLTIAHNVLSAAYLGFDGEGNLHVGGGQYLEDNPAELGFAALISRKHMDAVRERIFDSSFPFAPLDETRGSLYRQIQADPCGDDTATGILANGSDLTISWNGNETGACAGSNHDLWQPGSQPVLTTYHVDDTRDGDSDGIFDVADTSYNTYDPGNRDTDNDGYGNIIDGDFNNDDVVNFMDFMHFRQKYGTTDPHADLNSDGIVNFFDYMLFRGLYGKKAPYHE